MYRAVLIAPSPRPQIILRTEDAQRELLLEAAAFLNVPSFAGHTAAPGTCPYGDHVASSHPLAVMRSSFAESACALMPATTPESTSAVVGPGGSAGRGGGTCSADGAWGAASDGAGTSEGMTTFGAQLMLRASAVFPRDERLAYLAMRAAGGSGVRKTAKVGFAHSTRSDRVPVPAPCPVPTPCHILAPYPPRRRALAPLSYQHPLVSAPLVSASFRVRALRVRTLSLSSLPGRRC